MMGDWNFTDIDDAEMLADGGAPHHSRALAAWWGSHAGDTVEVPGEEPTRRQMRDGRIDQVATLDRANYVALEPDVMQLQPDLSHLFSVSDLRVPSDDAPILLLFGRRRGSNSRFRVPDHVAERNERISAPESGRLSMPSATMRHLLEHLKSCVEFVTQCIAGELRSAPPQSAVGKLAAGMRRWRAIRRHDTHFAGRTSRRPVVRVPLLWDAILVSSAICCEVGLRRPRGRWIRPAARPRT